MARLPRFPRTRAQRRANWRRKLKGWLFLAAVAATILAVRHYWPDDTVGDWHEVTGEVSDCGRGRAKICAVDGDTLLIGYGEGARRIRITGYNAPERDGECPAEIERAGAATAFLVEWLGRGPFEWDGGATPPRDRYGRELRRIRRLNADGEEQWLENAMITTGLGQLTDWYTPRGGWC